jgi:hypothetical protein
MDKTSMFIYEKTGKQKMGVLPESIGLAYAYPRIGKIQAS